MVLQICTFKWGSKYSAEHVATLFSMLARNLTIPWEPVLITDDPDDVPMWAGKPAFRVIPLWEEMKDAKLCGVRLRAFAEDMREIIGERFAWIDLDVVITGNVDHIFGRTEDFIALATPQGPLRYNGSLVMMDAGAYSYVHGLWTPEHYATLPTYYSMRGMHAGGQSDEGWMTLQLPELPTFNGGWGKREDGIYYFRKDLQSGRLRLPTDARMVVMNGRANDPSFPDLQRRCPWLVEHWV